MEKVYGVWAHSIDQTYAKLQTKRPTLLEPHCYNLSHGIAVGDAFPGDLVFDLSPDCGMHLTDSLRNIFSMQVVSERLKEVIAKTKQPVEFHRVQIRNHKKRLVGEPYYIMNLLGTVDCMNAAKSEWAESELEPGLADDIYRLDLDVDKIPNDTQLFRLAKDPRLVLVRLDLAREIYRGLEYRGMVFMKIDAYFKQFRDPDDDED